MRVEIRHEPNSDASFPCCSRTEVQGRDYFGIGRTWEDSEANLIMKLEAYYGQTPPPPRTVEIKVAGEEMATELLPWEDAPGRVIDTPAKV